MTTNIRSFPQLDSLAPVWRSAIAWGLVLSMVAGGTAPADDTALFASALPPNVVLLVDSSGSMNGIMYHKAYPGDSFSTTCDVIPSGNTGSFTIQDDLTRNVRANCGDSGCRLEIQDNATYYPDFVATSGLLGSSRSGYVERTFCGQTRRLYHDGNVQDRGADNDYSRYFDPYVDWYFTLDPASATTYGPDSQTAAEILAEVLLDDNGTNYITGAQYPLYKRARITAATEVAAEVMYRINSKCPPYLGDCLTYENNVRFGLAQFTSSARGGHIISPVGDYGSNKAALESALDGIDPGGNTPLAEALFQVYTYFMSRTDGDRVKVTKAGTTIEFPKYDYSLTGTGNSGSAPGDPVDLECRQNFVIVMTDGVPTDDDFSTSGTYTDGFGDFDHLIGDLAPDAVGDPDIGTDGTPEVGDPPWISSRSSGWLDDVALAMQQYDLRPDDFPNTHNTVDVYTLGFGVGGAAIEKLLEKTAANGNGTSTIASQSSELVTALIDSLAHIIEKTQSFTAATVPASRATDGNNFFASYFQPSDTSPYWEGHLKAFEFNALGEVRDKPVPPATLGNCALEDPLAPTRCAAGRLKIELPGFWDAADEIPVPSSRDLYVSLNGSSRPGSIPSTPDDFDTSLSTGDLDFSGLGLGIGDLGDFSVAGDTAGITTDDELKDAIVDYVRGCEFASGTCTDRGDGRKLWDIFHSNPVVVGPPNAGIHEESYREFVTRYKHRKRVIFAGSNGGFVHGFNAGEYDTLAMPDSYDRGDGVEEFGWMAYPARLNIAELPRSTKPKRYYMDGSSVASDVWLYPGAEMNPEDVSANPWNQWRTLLMGGMREGGRAYWALDVTNPPDHNSASGEQPTGPAYPGYMWEFPCESTDAECTGAGVVPSGRSYADYMGETWGEPIITRVRVTVDCSSGCTYYDRWVAIFGAGYDPAGDPNLTHNALTAAGTRATDSAAKDYDASFDADTSRAGRAVFMVDITTGEVLAMRRFDNTTTDGTPAMRYAFTAAPAVFDLNQDGYADVAYFGDLGGNMWKWVISDPVPDPINGTGDVEQPTWKFLKVFSAVRCGPIEGCVTQPHYRSFFFPPQGARVGAKLLLTFGSGERNDLDFVGTLNAQKNRFYVMADVDPLEREMPLPVAGVPRYADTAAGTDFVDAATLTGSCSPPPPPAVGYYLEGAHGEKFITESEIFFGIVLTGSFIPSTTASTCDAGGEAFLYAFKLFCGEGVLPPAGGGGGSPRVKVKIGDGLPNRPRVSVGPVDGGGGGGGGCTDMVVVITSEGEAFTDCPGGRPSSGVSLKTWRDR